MACQCSRFGLYLFFMTNAFANFFALVLLTLPALPVPTKAKPSKLRNVEVVARDYTFEVPKELPPGPAAFHFSNRGNVRHEFNLALLKEGVTLDQYLKVLWEGKPVSALLEGPVGVLFAGKGKESAADLVTNLKAGRDYVIICIFKDKPDAKRHHQLGMFSLIHISGRRNIPDGSQKIDTIVGTDYAFMYPAALKPGIHTFAFVNKGKQRHELAFALLKPGVSVADVVDADKAGKSVKDLIEFSPGLLHSPAGETPLGLFRMNLLPGREYMIECGFQDSDKSPPHYELGMFGSIKVARK